MNPGIPGGGVDASDEIARLIEVLHDADRRLEALLGGEVDSVMDRSGKPFLLRTAQEHLRQREDARQATILNALPARIALLDANGTIVTANSAWMAFASREGSGASGHVAGLNYLDACDHATGTHADCGSQISAGVRSVLDGTAPALLLEYRLPMEPPCWFSLRAAPIASTPRQVVVMHMDITPRKNAAEALERLSHQTQYRERMFNTMLSSISDFAYIFDAQGRFLFANQPLLDLWGAQLPEVIGKTFTELGLYTPEAATRLQGEIEQVFATGDDLVREMPYESPRGAPGHYEYIFSPARGADGNIDFVVGSTRDVTRRRATEAALRESVADFSALATAMPQIVWEATPGGHLTYCNERFAAYTGVASAGALGKAWAALIHEEDRRPALQAWLRRAGDDTLPSRELRLRGRDGAYRWWLVRGAALHDTAGRLHKWIGTCTDIDELKQAQLEVIRTNRELRTQQLEMRALVNLVPAAIVFKDTQNRLLRVNERMARLTGKTVAEIEGKTAEELFPKHAARFAAEDAEIVRTGRPCLGIMQQLVGADGRQIWVQSDKVPYLDDNGKVVGIAVMSQDVTQRQQDQDNLQELNANLEDRVRARTVELVAAREEADRANGAKSEFLATMSHEIRTPMSGMLGMLELLGLSPLDADQHSTLAVARESANALLQIIDDILDFSKIEANRLELNPVPGHVRAAVETACRLHSQVASSKNLTLHAHVAPEVADCLQFDPLRLGQVLNNFLNNAVKFTARGEVALSVELLHDGIETQHLLFQVRDTGVGMDQEQLARLFQPFAQGSRDTGVHFGGTGLGLVIARRLAQLMGGSVAIRSELGTGTTLTLDVVFETCVGLAPAAAGPGDVAVLQALVAGRRAAPSVAEAEDDGTLLLVVDDHPINRRVLLGQVASLGYAAEAVGDGVEALTAWRTGRYCAVITDCNMPRMNGYEFAVAVRSVEEAERWNRTPIIGCTANALTAARARCLAAGMDDCLVKPVDIAEMGRQLDRWAPIGAAAAPAPEGAVLGAMRAFGNAGAGLLDAALLAAIAGGDPRVQAEILREFRRANEADAAALRHAANTGDFRDAMQFSHRIKGSSLMLGATFLAHACGELEAAGAAREPLRLKQAMEAFEMAFSRLNLHLDALLATAPDAGPAAGLTS